MDELPFKELREEWIGCTANAANLPVRTIHVRPLRTEKVEIILHMWNPIISLADNQARTDETSRHLIFRQHGSHRINGSHGRKAVCEWRSHEWWN